MPRKNFILFAILVLFASACGTQLRQAEPTQTTLPTLTPTPMKLPLTEAEVLRVSVGDAQAALANGTAVVVDVRSPSAFEVSHISGALNISLSDIEFHPTDLKLDKNQWIITYCA